MARLETWAFRERVKNDDQGHDDSPTLESTLAGVAHSLRAKLGYLPKENVPMAIHHFQPTHYHTAIGPFEPILRIEDGDTVVTTTVDAYGKDASNIQVTPEGNPQTGPFYVVGAEPGDTLVVRLEKISPNRAIGYTGSVVAPNVVEPSYVRELPEGEMAEWRVDNESGTATLIKTEDKARQAWRYRLRRCSAASASLRGRARRSRPRRRPSTAATWTTAAS